MFTGTPVQKIFSGLGPTPASTNYVYYTCDPNTFVLTGMKAATLIVINQIGLTGKLRYLPYDYHVPPTNDATSPPRAPGHPGRHSSGTSNPLSNAEGAAPRPRPSESPSLTLNGRTVSPGVLTSFNNGCLLEMATAYTLPFAVTIFIDSFDQSPNGVDNDKIESIPRGLTAYATALLPRSLSNVDQVDPNFTAALQTILQAFGVPTFSALSYPDDPQLLRRYGEIVLFVYAASSR